MQLGTAVLSCEEIAAVRELFTMASSRADASVTRQEAVDALAILQLPGTEGLGVSQSKIQNDNLTMENALQAVLLQSPSLYSYHELLSAFTLFADPDGSSGCITYKALKNALVKYCGAQVLGRDIEKVLLEVAKGPAEYIDYHELISTFFSLVPKGKTS